MKIYITFLGVNLCVLLALVVLHLAKVSNSIDTYMRLKETEIKIAQEQLEVTKDQLEVNKTKLVLDFCGGAGRFYDGKFECVKE